jgi:tRNA(Ile)-lysidine synthetase-like protein
MLVAKSNCTDIYIISGQTNMNRFEAKWLAAINAGGDNISNVKILVACSGGGDSIALLMFLLAIQNNLGIQLTVAHANHGLRPEAKLEADLVRKLCYSVGLQLFETQLKVAQHAKNKNIGLETAARELRWDWFKHIALSNDIAAVATGHNLDDHTETVMLRLSRGGGTGCLTPLHRRQDLRWSPLIQVRRKELRKYLNQKGVSWLDDASNLEPFTPRNRWRKLLEPVRLEAPAIDYHLWESHLQITELINFRDRYVYSWRGLRWEIIREPRLALLLTRDWEEIELRWTLEAAFKDCFWHRESKLLRDLASWMMHHLQRRSNKNKEWGGWQLEASSHMLSAIKDNLLPKISTTKMPWALVRKS